MRYINSGYCGYIQYIVHVYNYTVKPVLRDHCHARPPVLTDHTMLAEGPIFQYNWTCHQRPPVLTDHIFVANGFDFQDRFHCIVREQPLQMLWIRSRSPLSHPTPGYTPLALSGTCCGTGWCPWPCRRSPGLPCCWWWAVSPPPDNSGNPGSGWYRIRVKIHASSHFSHRTI